MQAPLITVLTSYYNDQRFLADAISSVLAQTYTNFEYILINHASTDKSREIAHSFQDSRIKHIDLPVNYGGSGNILIQKALDVAQGEYLKTLGADDMLHPDGLEKLLITAQTKQADLVFGNVALVKEDKTPLEKTWFEHRYPAGLPTVKYLSYFMRGVSVFPYAGNLIRVDSLKQISLDYVSIQLADMGVWASLLLHGARLAFVQDPVADYRIHKGQMCSSANFDIIGLRCQFEHFLFYQHFFDAQPSLKTLKELFPGDKQISQLTENDQEFYLFCFVHALYHLKANPVCMLACRLRLAQLLNDYPFHQRLEKRFGISIRQLREDIVKNPILVRSIRYPLLPDGTKGIKQTIFGFVRRIIGLGLLLIWKIKSALKKDNPKENTGGFV